MRELVLSYEGKPGARELLAPADTVTGITSTVIKPATGQFKNKHAKCVVIQNKGVGNAKFTIDGTDPTALAGTNIGFVLTQYSSYIISDKDAIDKFRVVDNVSGALSKIEVVAFF